VVGGVSGVGHREVWLSGVGGRACGPRRQPGWRVVSVLDTTQYLLSDIPSTG